MRTSGPRPGQGEPNLRCHRHVWPHRWGSVARAVSAAAHMDFVAAVSGVHLEPRCGASREREVTNERGPSGRTDRHCQELIVPIQTIRLVCRDSLGNPDEDMGSSNHVPTESGSSPSHSPEESASGRSGRANWLGRCRPFGEDAV